MRVLGLLIVLGMALAQSLVVPQAVSVGESMIIRGQGIAPGSYRLSVEGPGGPLVQILEITGAQDSFRLTYLPSKTGAYLVGLSGGALALKAGFTAAVSVAKPIIERGVLAIGDWHLPLPGKWMGPVEAGGYIYVACPLVILQIDPGTPLVVNHYYPSSPIAGLKGGRRLVVEMKSGTQATLADLFNKVPFQGDWAGLAQLAAYQQAVAAVADPAKLDTSPRTDWPYWAYFTLPPGEVSAQDLEAWGVSRLLRGGRVLLPFGGGATPWLSGWAKQASVARADGIEASTIWSAALLNYAPIFPGARVFFQGQADWLTTQGRPDLAVRYRAALTRLEQDGPSPLQGDLLAFLYVLGALYLLWGLWLVIRHTGRSMGWFSFLPETRASRVEVVVRLLVVVCFAAGLAMLGLGQKTGRFLQQDALLSGDLMTQAATRAFSRLPETPESRGLLGYSMMRSDPQQAETLLEQAKASPYVLTDLAMLKDEPALLARAYYMDPNYAPAAQALGLPGDQWTAVYSYAGVVRRGVPDTGAQWDAVFSSYTSGFLANPLTGWATLPLWPNALIGYLTLLLLLLLALYHLLALLVSRSKGAYRLSWTAWLLALLFPGSTLLGSGYGLLLLAGLAYGLMGLWQGYPAALWVLVAAYALHLIPWALSLPRRRA